jgi:hypothetical protein
LELARDAGTGTTTKDGGLGHSVFIPVQVGGRKALDQMKFELHGNFFVEMSSCLGKGKTKTKIYRLE